MVRNRYIKKGILCCLVIILSACSSHDKTSVAEETSVHAEMQVDETTTATVTESSAEEETTTVSEADNAVQTDYIFPDSDKKFIEFETANLKSDEDLRIGRNEIYARHGRKFSDAKLQAYFDSKDWYQGTIFPEEFDESILSLEEKNNIRSLSNLEFQREILSTKQAYRYDYDSTAFANANGQQRKNILDYNSEYLVITPIDFDHISVESHTFWGNKTIKFSRVGFDFEGPINYNNESTEDYKDGYMNLGKSEISVLIDGNDCIDYYTR